MTMKMQRGRPKKAETHLVVSYSPNAPCIKCRLRGAQPRRRCPVKDNADHGAIRVRYCG